MTVQEAFQDQDFISLLPTEKIKALSAIDTDFAGLPTVEQLKVVVPTANQSLLSKVGNYVKEAVLGIPEAAYALGTGAAGSIIAPVAGNITAAYEGLTGNPNWGTRAQQVSDATRDLLTYRPISQSGQALTELIAPAIGLPYQGLQKTLATGAKLAATPVLGEYPTKEKYPNFDYTVNSGADTAALALTPRVAGAVQNIGSRVPEVAQKVFNNVVDYGLTKGIRPSVAGRSTSALAQRKIATGRDMVQSIIENKNNIQLTDPKTGAELPEGSLPSGNNSLIQMADAMNQTKLNIAKDINAMKEGATGEGVKVPLDNIVAALDEKLQSPVVQDVPELYDYIQKQRDIFAKRGEYSVKDADAQIVRLNNKERIKKYYNDPNPNSMDYMTVDADIVRGLRESLDNSITSTEGPGFQELKNKYGSILDHEKEVNQRAVVSARRNPKGLADLSDIAIAAEVARGIASVAAGVKTGGVSLASAVGMDLAKRYWKGKNDPNNIISDMFKKADKNFGYYGTSLKESLPPVGPYDPWADQRGWKEPISGLIENTLPEREQAFLDATKEERLKGIIAPESQPPPVGPGTTPSSVVPKPNIPYRGTQFEPAIPKK